MTRIDQLDLRPEAMILAMQIAEGNERIERALDKMWDWPHAPWFVLRRHIDVTITADTAALNEALARINWVTLLTAKTWDDYYHWTFGETVQGGSITWNLWGRWNLRENWPIYLIAIALVIYFCIGVDLLWQ